MVRNESLHEIGNDNGVIIVNIATSKILSWVQYSHITEFINTLKTSTDWKTQNEINHVLFR